MVKESLNVWRDLGHLSAVGFGSGLSPVAPGTVGSLAALVVGLPFLFASPLGFAVATAILTVVSVPIAGRTATALGVHDHPSIVIDEWAGLWLALVSYLFLSTAASQTGGSQAPAPIVNLCKYGLLTFVWFRFFDIVKPWPISLLDRHMRGGLGIVMDDLAAGLAAGLCAYFCFRLIQ